MASPVAGLDHLLKLVNGLTLESASEKYPNCFPKTNPLDLLRAHLADILVGISGVEPKIAYGALQWTSSLEKGDLVLAAPALRIKGKKPADLATELAEKFPEDDPLVGKPVLSAHFLQFYFKTGPLTQSVLPMIRQLGAEYGRNTAVGLKDQNDPSKGRQRVIVEFSSPNIAKPFHVGHLRSTIIGGFLSHLYEQAGYDVIRINYLGDWGKQYGLLAVSWEKYGDEEALSKDPIDHLFHLYVRINQDLKAEQEKIAALKAEGKDTTELENNGVDEEARRYFKKMTDGDEKSLALWKRFRDLSIVRYKETYARLNIKFDRYSGESQVSETAMAASAKTLEEKNISEESEGARIIDFSKLVPKKEAARLGKAIIRKKDGTALYLTRDVSELLARHEEYKFDKMIYVVASQQDLHLQQLFRIVGLMGHQEEADKCVHINFGMVQGMKTRTGDVKFLDDILHDVADKMHEVMRTNDKKYSQVENPEATAYTLGISSVMVQDMTGKRVNGYKFNMDAMTSFEGDTGPYLQYAHARMSSIERKAAVPAAELDAADLSLLAEDHAADVVRMLAQWPDVVQNTLKTLEPATVLTYLFRMTHAVSSSYGVLQVVGSKPELLRARMVLYNAARIVLANGMRLLGLSPLERM